MSHTYDARVRVVERVSGGEGSNNNSLTLHGLHTIISIEVQSRE
jgi:hypothetical protein